MLEVIPHNLVMPARPDPTRDEGFVVLFEPGGRWSMGPAPSWLTVTRVEPEIEPGLGRVDFKLEPNPGREHRGSITITSGRDTRRIDLLQQSGRIVQQQIDQVLKAPIGFELAAAAKFLAQEILKTPPPAWAPLTAAVEALATEIGGDVVAARDAFVTVPEPKPVFDVPPLPVPVTTQAIVEQVEKFDALFAEEIANQAQ